MRLSGLPSVYRALSCLERPYSLLVIEGSDDFFRDDCCERYREFWKNVYPDGDVKAIAAANLLARQELLHEGASLFGSKTLYVLEEVSHLKGKKAAELVALLQQARGELFFLLIATDSIPKEILADAEACGAVFSLPTMKPWERQPFVVSWIQSFVKKRGKAIDKDAAGLLAQAYSSDRGGLKGELEKLGLYRLHDPAISLQDVEEIGTIELRPTMWQLLDGLLAKDAKMVASCLAQSGDMHDIAVLRFVKNQLERLLVALEGGAPVKNKAQERQMAIVRKRGAPTLTAWINRLKMQEVAIRSGVEEGEEGSLLPFFLSLCL